MPSSLQRISAQVHKGFYDFFYAVGKKIAESPAKWMVATVLVCLVASSGWSNFKLEVQ
jgi:hypothetical protein